MKMRLPVRAVSPYSVKEVQQRGFGRRSGKTREGLATLIAGSPGFQIAGAYPYMEELLPALEADLPDVLLADIGLPGMSGITGVRLIHERYPQMPILMLTVLGDDDSVFGAICAGACGYLLKETQPARLLAYIRELHAGGAPMSPEIARRVVKAFRGLTPATQPDTKLAPRQLEILQLLAEGHSYKSCAEKLKQSLDTVRFHVRNIYDRLHVHSRSEAVWKALESGLVRRSSTGSETR